MKIPLRKYWSLLGRYLGPQKGRVALLALSMFIGLGLQLLDPQIMRYFIDTAMAGGEMRLLIRAALLFLGVALVSRALTILNTYLAENVGWIATNALRHDLALHVLKLDQGFHKAHRPGELLERIDTDVTNLANFFSRFVVSVAGNALLVLGILIALYREDWRVGLPMTLFVGGALWALIRIRGIGVPYWKESRRLQTEWYGYLGEQLEGTEDIRANGATAYVMRRFYELTRPRLPAQFKAGVAGYSMWISMTVVFALGTALTFGLGAALWRAGALTIGTVFLLTRYTDLLRGPISNIRHEITDLQQAEASMERIEELQATTSALAEGHEAELPAGPLSVACDDVHFHYEDDEPVLQGIDLYLAPGRVMGLLGRTGSGKTTLARLLLRLYDPVTGQVRLNGIPLDQVPLRQVRDRVAMVTQEVQLFQATVRDNLTLFNPAISDARLLAVLDELGLTPWLEALPQGLDTELEAGGGGLSAGQAQLLAFARVFLTDPGLVILDEASSRLDPATEALIERAVDRLLADRTGVMIAHRLATVHRADEIMILEGGRIVEYGPRAELAADPDSRFYHLLQTGLEEVLA